MGHMEHWVGRAVIIGGAAMTADQYPISLGIESDDGLRVDCQLHEPAEVPGNFGRNILRQEMDLELLADEERAHATAFEMLRMVADAVGFVAGQRVEIKLPAISTKPTGEARTPVKTIPTMMPTKMPDRLVGVPMKSIGHIWQAIDDPTAERGRRIVRAMRWLRRSVGALDEVEEFTVLAFALEAAADLLPRPDDKWLAEKREGQGDGSRKPDRGEVLRHFATAICGVDEEKWRKVGSPRHELFHGGLTENADTVTLLAEAIPILRTTVIRAIKQTLGLAESDPPAAASLALSLRGLVLSMDAPLTFTPPNSEIRERIPMLLDDTADETEPPEPAA
jgi:hypothetical protein